MKIFQKIQKKIYKFYNIHKSVSGISQLVTQLLVANILADIRRTDPKALLLSGWKVFSQCDEDGIIDTIFKKIGTTNKTFVEIGCGDGLENNTHYLALNGWRGVWIDGSRSHINFIKSQLQTNNVIKVVHCFLTTENAERVVIEALQELGKKTVDLLSIDIDGNDIHILKCLEKIDARVVVMEYNPALRPPLNISMKYDEHHVWQHDIYQGASLQALYNYLSKRNYALVGCNLSGYNAFFVKKTELKDLPDLTPEEAFQPSRLFAVRYKTGHPSSMKFLKNIITESSLD